MNRPNFVPTRILIVAAHPDDEVLGCGGVMAAHAAKGDDVYVLILAEGATSRDVVRNIPNRGDELTCLRQAGRSAAVVLGVNPPRFLGLPDNRLDSLPLLDVIKKVEYVIQEIEPTVIYTHHGGDLNVDHSITLQAVLTACRPIPGSLISAIYTFETVSSTEWNHTPTHNPFIPTRFVNVTDYIDKKIQALLCYDSEMRDYPHARSLDNVKNLAQWRGASVGLAAAEAFMVIREVIS